METAIMIAAVLYIIGFWVAFMFNMVALPQTCKHCGEKMHHLVGPRVAAPERDAANELERLRAALLEVKAYVCGDRHLHWREDNYRVTLTRSTIADICDVALGNQQSQQEGK